MDTGTALLHESDDNRSQKKGRPRGRPFKTKAELAEIARQNLDARGPDGGDGGQVVEPEGEGIKLVTNGSGAIPEPVGSRGIEAPIMDEVSELPERDMKPVLVETIEFTNGKNTLSIVFSRRHNRMYQMKVVLNGKTELRPNTFTGASSGFGYWNLLKESLE